MFLTKGFPTNFRKSTPCKFQNPFVHDALESSSLRIICGWFVWCDSFPVNVLPWHHRTFGSRICPMWPPPGCQWQRFIGIPLLLQKKCNDTVDVWNLAPPRMMSIPLFIGFYTSQVVVWDFILGGCRTARLANDLLSFPTFAPCGPNGTDGHRTTAATTREPKKKRDANSNSLEV